jgi:hypothetical protein
MLARLSRLSSSAAALSALVSPRTARVATFPSGGPLTRSQVPHTAARLPLRFATPQTMAAARGVVFASAADRENLAAVEREERAEERLKGVLTENLSAFKMTAVDAKIIKRCVIYIAPGRHDLAH